MRLGREADRSHPSSSEIKIELKESVDAVVPLLVMSSGPAQGQIDL